VSERHCGFRNGVMVLMVLIVSLIGAPVVLSGTILEDFRNPEEDGFPHEWEGSRSTVTAKEAYAIHREGDTMFLRGTRANQRVYTRHIEWNPKTHPVLRWRWRLQSVPENADFLVALFANLDTDLLFIPVSTKYVWSDLKRKGSVTDGGLFGAAEIVVRSGRQPLGVWVEEEVNAYEDFQKIHRHDPASRAWGISLQSGPGVEVDFGTIEVSAE